VSRCVVLVKQHSMTQLSSSLLFQCRPNSSNQISVVGSRDSAAVLEIINQYSSLSIPEYSRHNFASRRHNAKLSRRWRRGVLETLRARCLLYAQPTPSKQLSRVQMHFRLRRVFGERIWPNEKSFMIVFDALLTFFKLFYVSVKICIDCNDRLRGCM